MDVVYLDNNATTRPAPEVVDAMLPFLTEYYGNPSSVHRFGQYARKAIDDARASVAALVGCRESELVFTGASTESINTAIRGLLALRAPRNKIIISTVEHSATRQLCEQLAREGARIVQVGVDEQGRLNEAALAEEMTEDAALVSLIWANNETGVLFPIADVAARCRAAKIPLHVDATQAIGKIPVDFGQIGVDAASFAAHKFHGPKGVAGLYARRGIRLRPLIIGGPQERDRRGGTENVPGIVGMGRAAELARSALVDMPAVAARRDRLEQGILENIFETSVNGATDARVPNTTNIAFWQLEAEAILLLLSEQNICASAGAACSSGSLEPSPILKAMGIPPKKAHGAIRFSLSRYTIDAEIDQTLRILPPIISRLRQVMPVGT